MNSRMILSSGSSSRAQSGSQQRTLANSLPAVSFRRASDHILEQGVTTIVSLNGDSELPPEVQCMATEFQEVIQGEISSVMSPMTLSLKESESKTKVKISNLKKVVSTLKRESFQFYRVDRLKILYIPLFPETEAEGKSISFSIQDRSIMIAGKPKKVSSIEAPLNKMSMIELSSSYFVEKNKIDMIEFGYKATGVPVTGRAFAAVYLAFYIHKELIPARLKAKQPIVLIIKDVEIPTDINTVSSIKKICDKVNKQIRANSETFQKEKLKNQLIAERKEEEILFVDNFESGNKFRRDSAFTEDTECEVGECSRTVGIMNGALIAEKNIPELLPRRLPVWDWEGVILDTGAPDHWFYNPNLVGLDRMTMSNSYDNSEFFRVKGVEVKLGVHWVRLKEILYACKESRPLISYTRLVKAGIVDSLRASGSDKHALYLDGKVMFNLESSSGYMVFSPSKEMSREMLIE